MLHASVFFLNEQVLAAKIPLYSLAITSMAKLAKLSIQSFVV